MFFQIVFYAFVDQCIHFPPANKTKCPHYIGSFEVFIESKKEFTQSLRTNFQILFRLKLFYTKIDKLFVCVIGSHQKSKSSGKSHFSLKKPIRKVKICYAMFMAV